MAARVLIVQSREALAHATGRQLQGAGFEPTLALDGDAALRSARIDPPDAVLLDLTLPVLDGWLVLAALADAERPVKIVVYGERADEGRALQLGADVFVSDWGMVSDGLRRLIEEHHPWRPSPAITSRRRTTAGASD